MNACRRSFIVVIACVAVGLSSLAPPVWAQPALPGDRIADLRALEQHLQQGEIELVSQRAADQASALEGGNAADSWARALYLQLAAGALARQGQHAQAADTLNLARSIEVAGEAWRAARLRDEALLRRSAGQTESAVELLGAWLAQQPGEASDHWRMARLLAELSRWDDAVEWVERAHESAAADSDQQELAATIYQRSGQGERALAVLEAELDTAPAPEWRRAAALAQRIGAPGRAAAIWEAGWRQGVLSGAEDLRQLVELHLAGGTPARAAEWLEEALENGTLTDDLEQRRLLANAWQAARDHQRALAAWQHVAQQSGTGEDWLALGQLAHTWGETSIARRALEAASEQGVEEADAWLSNLSLTPGDTSDTEMAGGPETDRAQSDSSVHTGA